MVLWVVVGGGVWHSLFRDMSSLRPATRQARRRIVYCTGHQSRSPVDRVLSACKVHGTRKVVNYTVPR